LEPLVAGLVCRSKCHKFLLIANLRLLSLVGGGLDLRLAVVLSSGKGLTVGPERGLRGERLFDQLVKVKRLGWEGSDGPNGF
jgi:hypothetical protein